eukprot:2387362-Prymnesium_polylepis.1
MTFHDLLQMTRNELQLCLRGHNYNYSCLHSNATEPSHAPPDSLCRWQLRKEAVPERHLQALWRHLDIHQRGVISAGDFGRFLRKAGYQTARSPTHGPTHGLLSVAMRRRLIASVRRGPTPCVRVCGQPGRGGRRARARRPPRPG